MHTVKESGTFTSKDGTKSTQLTAGDQIDEQEAADLGLISKPRGRAEGGGAEQQQQEQKAKPAAPENKSR
jgi:hypothetical protein